MQLQRFLSISDMIGMVIQPEGVVGEWFSVLLVTLLYSLLRFHQDGIVGLLDVLHDLLVLQLGRELDLDLGLGSFHVTLREVVDEQLTVGRIQRLWGYIGPLLCESLGDLFVLFVVGVDDRDEAHGA